MDICFEIDGDKILFEKRESALILIIFTLIMSRVFANVPEDRGSIPGRVIPKIKETVFDSALLHTQHYEVRIKGKVEQSRKWCNALPYDSV